MRLLRNKEVRRELCVSMVIVFASTIIGLLIRPICGVALLVAGCLYCAIHLYFLARRYRALSNLAEQVDRVLHGQETFRIQDSNEGELSVLNSEIQKMTVTLREQAGQLRTDKVRLSEAIADMFHQMRTPLTSMNLIVTLLAEENLPYIRRIELTRELRKQLERISWLVETLLKLSKLDAGVVSFRQETLVVRELIEEAARPFLIRMELREQSLHTEIENEHLTGDPEWIAEALSNLIKNCVEHTPAKGSVCIFATETALYTEIRIRDNGPGFHPEDIPHIFERFYKGKDASVGSIGIGLALARSIITLQNGTISARNAPEGGAEYTVKFYKSVI